MSGANLDASLYLFNAIKFMNGILLTAKKFVFEYQMCGYIFSLIRNSTHMFVYSKQKSKKNICLSLFCLQHIAQDQIQPHFIRSPKKCLILNEKSNIDVSIPT